MLYTHNQKILPEVQEDFIPPVSAWTSLAGMFLVGTVGSAIGLSSWVKYNVTVKAAATVRPIGDIRLVQPKMEGTVKNILVKENQIVKQGDVIAYLDVEQLRIKKSQLLGNLQQGRLQLIQIDAQINSLDTQIIAEKRVIEKTVSSAQSDLARNQRDYEERQINSQSEFQAAAANLQKAYADLQKAYADLDFAKLDRDRYEQLASSGAIGRREYEEKKLIVEQIKSTIEGEKRSIDIAKAKVQSAKAAVNPTKATVVIAQERIAQETARGEATIATLEKEKQALMQHRIDMQNQFSQSVKEIQQIENQLKSSIIRATSDGIILKLNLRNPGQVVRISEPIAEIVPQDAPLVIKAVIPTAEIKNVAVGQKVQLRVDACAYPDYGTLKGVVNAISPDVITPQSNNTGAAIATTTPSASYFEVNIQPESIAFGNNNHQCHIQSGMDAKADIISKEETALQFMLRKARLITDL
ncbi:hemolysin D [Nostoc sp. T09]|uniref:HlyD family efflux transporter periplasmic adaptor subunit n=1 Tax=Nostoc sp. T09 TaxID=1932621 RepID=UPI000A3BC370|nr:HlyD family efflux transporter periplasmic adaptor subunit [Nostoc sp. T09]OUL36974.1 hemolysin D [Nostoc sp. T09]